MAPTWTISLELGPRGPGSGPSTRTVRQADGTSPALRGRPGPAPREEGTSGAAGPELPAGSSRRRKPQASAFGPCLAPGAESTSLRRDPDSEDEGHLSLHPVASCGQPGDFQR